MAIPFKKIARKNPHKTDAVAKFYPQLVTLGQTATLARLAATMKRTSSLSLGDIQSVLTNFVEAMRDELYNGKAVNIKDFGVFTLSARTKGTENKEECVSKNIMAVRINFRPSTSIRPSLVATRAEDQLDFLDLEEAMKKKNETGGGEDPGGGEAPDPGV